MMTMQWSRWLGDCLFQHCGARLLCVLMLPSYFKNDVVSSPRVINTLVLIHTIVISLALDHVIGVIICYYYYRYCLQKNHSNYRNKSVANKSRLRFKNCFYIMHTFVLCTNYIYSTIYLKYIRQSNKR